MSEKFDVIIIGGGPGGYVAAIRAAQLKMKVALVEEKHLGGICLNWGCIPTKALLRSAELYHYMQHAEEYGLKIKDVSFDFEKIIQRSRGVASHLSAGIKHLMKKNKVTVFDARASLLGGKKVSLQSADCPSEIEAKHIILATGARARVLPGLEPDGELIWTYKEAMTPKTLPKSVLIMGSGAIGIEFASFYNAFGAQVTVVELAPRILPVEDKEISDLAGKIFAAKGIKIITNAKTQIKKENGKISASFETTGGTRSQTQFDKLILAVGIDGNVENIGLEKTKITVEKGHIITDEWCQTHEPGVYAIGDVAGAPWLAHKASHEAIMCVEKIAGLPNVHKLNRLNIPGCTYSSPQIASVGLTEEKALELGHKIKVGRFPFIANGKAIALGETDGLVKTIFDEKTGELLGAHMIGAEVTEMIQGYVVTKTMEGTELDLIHTIFPHPTLSEMMHESVLAAYDKTLHI